MLQKIGIDFRIEIPEIQEVIPVDVKGYERVVYLSRQKAETIKYALVQGVVIIAADTMVILDGKELGKPHDNKEAMEMLEALSGKEHEVVTGVTLKSIKKTCSFYCVSNILFGDFSSKEIANYISNYEPYDKAGSYGIQDCLAPNGDKKGPLDIRIINGSYYNVVGLPIEKLKKELEEFTTTLSNQGR